MTLMGPGAAHRQHPPLVGPVCHWRQNWTLGYRLPLLFNCIKAGPPPVGVHWCPDPPFHLCPHFHVCSPGCCIHPVLYVVSCLVIAPCQARNQLGTPGGRKSFLRGPYFSNYVRHIFPEGAKNSKEASPTPAYGPVLCCEILATGLRKCELNAWNWMWH